MPVLAKDVFRQNHRLLISAICMIAILEPATMRQRVMGFTVSSTLVHMVIAQVKEKEDQNIVIHINNVS